MISFLEATGNALVHRTGNNNKEKRKKEKRSVVIGRLEAYLSSRGNERKECYRGRRLHSLQMWVAHIACGDLMIASVPRYDEYWSEG
jgi:hypothetical protein